MKFNELPKAIQNKMLDRQEQQGNLRNPAAFEKHIDAPKHNGGFTWADTPEKDLFWRRILNHGILDEFFQLYPETTYPKVMWVSDAPIHGKESSVKRVVFMEKCGKFLTWSDSETLEQAKLTWCVTEWSYAKDIEPELKRPEELMPVEAQPVTISIEHITLCFNSDEKQSSDTDIDKSLEGIFANYVIMRIREELSKK